MNYLLDANIVILVLSGHPTAVTRLATCDIGDVAISAIAFAEVALGSARGKPPPPEVLNAFLGQIMLLPFDEAAARTYAHLPFKRGSYDRLIAAHALSLELTLVTNNEADFADVPRLKVENWTI